MCSCYGLVYEVLKTVICKISKRQTNYVQYPLNIAGINTNYFFTST
jgi:hypothetical protein